MNKPSIPKGTRDFSPLEMRRRNYIFDVIKKTFEGYGFNQIETPSMENLSSLTGKYGDEGDRLIFKVLNRGDKFLKAVKSVDASTSSLAVLEQSLCNEGLRYDLTVPFARYVVQHQNELTFPFKRFQIQPVWRADRPQKGRYREFFQCDADIIGSDSLLNEIDFIQIISTVFNSLKINNVVIKLNNRKILSAIAGLTGQPDKIIDITVAIDKLDKIGEDAVVTELIDKGLNKSSISFIKPLLSLKGDNLLILKELKKLLSSSKVGVKGVDELEFLVNYFLKYPLKDSALQLDMTLARGLNYYTGAIFEVVVDGAGIGSVSGGGRYDDLTGVFGLKNISGVGISFGADRIYDVMIENNLFPDFKKMSTQLLIVNQDVDPFELNNLANKFRLNEVVTELYPDQSKLKKQLKYANGIAVPFVLFCTDIGTELQLELKDMNSGNQEVLGFSSIVNKLKNI